MAKTRLHTAGVVSCYVFVFFDRSPWTRQESAGFSPCLKVKDGYVDQKVSLEPQNSILSQLPLYKRPTRRGKQRDELLRDLSILILKPNRRHHHTKRREMSDEERQAADSEGELSSSLSP